MKFSNLGFCFGILFAASTCFAQMYTVTDLGTLRPTGINFGSQVVGNLNGHAYLWTNGGGFQDLGILPGGSFSSAAAINDLGVVTGSADGLGTVISPYPDFLPDQQCGDLTQPFVWTLSTGMHGIGTRGIPGLFSAAGDANCIYAFYGRDINASGEIVGDVPVSGNFYAFGFQWTSTSGMSLFGGSWPPTFMNAISNTGLIVGQNSFSLMGVDHGIAWSSDVGDLGTLGSETDRFVSSANGVNELGLIVGWSSTGPAFFSVNPPVHAVVWNPSQKIQDIGTLAGDISSAAIKVNFFGQVIGSSGNTLYVTNDIASSPFEVIGHPFIWSEHSVVQDINTLIPDNSGWILGSATDINSWGQIVGTGTLNGESHGFLLEPIYKAFVQQPVNGDGSSVFNAKRGVIPFKFSLTQSDLPTCTLSPATIAITRTAGGTLGAIDESTYVSNADSGSDFKISGCQYSYNVAASSLGVGTYRVDISINGIMVGHAVFALK